YLAMEGEQADGSYDIYKIQVSDKSEEPVNTASEAKEEAPVTEDKTITEATAATAEPPVKTTGSVILWIIGGAVVIAGIIIMIAVTKKRGNK
ncbi:MAG: hypothetical protein ILP13_00555, partial [Lachnospiraceae bacterium]|nr:hypothetical protein [Lachnospiraceae bacterium]